MRFNDLRYSQYNREPAGLFVRFVAMAIDGLILLSLLTFSGAMLYFLLFQYGDNQESFSGLLGLVKFKALFMGLPAIFISYIYYGTFYSCYGASPGKMFMGLRAVDYYSGENLGLLQVLFREFFGKWLSALLFFFGYFLSVLRKDGRALHDFFASTQIIAE